MSEVINRYTVQIHVHYDRESKRYGCTVRNLASCFALKRKPTIPPKRMPFIKPCIIWHWKTIFQAA